MHTALYYRYQKCFYIVSMCVADKGNHCPLGYSLIKAPLTHHALLEKKDLVP